MCGAERRAEFYAVPEVRDAAGYFAGLVRMLAYSSLPLPDVAAAAAAWWGRQLGVRLAPAERAERVLAHMLHCGAPAWTLRLGLMRCGGQAVAAVAAGARHLDVASPRPPAGAARRLADQIAAIAAAARAHLAAHLAGGTPPPADALAFADVPPAPTARWCLLCHGGAAGGDSPHARLAALYAQKFAPGGCARAAEAADAVAMGVCENDRDKLGATRPALAACALEHYVRHDASPAALLHKLRAAHHAVTLAMLGCGVRTEGGTLVPDVRGMKDMRRAEGAIADLQRAVDARPGAERLCGIAPRGLSFAPA